MSIPVKNTGKKPAPSRRVTPNKKPVRSAQGKEDAALKVSSKKRDSESGSDLPVEELVQMRNKFYETGAKKLKVALISSSIMFGMAVVTTFLAVTVSPDKTYFAADEAGQYIQLVPLRYANHSAPVVAQWLEDALVDVFDFNYLNMKDQLNQKTLKYFTDSGRNSLIAAIQEKGIFDTIVAEKLISQLSVNQKPVLVKEGGDNSGKYEWIFQIPVTFTYTNESNVYVNKVLFTVSVVRRSMLEDIKGLGINKVILESLN